MKGVEVQLESIVKSYSGVKALNNVNLTIPRGSITTLLGPSGCGKTTTLKLIAGLEEPDRGRILFDGEDVTQVPPDKRGIGMVFQDLALFPHMTVYDNIAFGLRVRGYSEQEIRRRVREMLELVNLDPGSYSNRKPNQLSGGQQQRVALARALVIEPRVLLLDEPFSHLDYKIKQKLLLELRRLQRRLGITTVYVTHDQTEAMNISDKVVIMNNGSIIQEGDPLEVYENPANPFVATFYGDANIVDAGKLGLEGGLVAVRPEDLILDPVNGVDLTKEGVVEDVIFQGPLIRVDVRINGSTLKVFTPRNRKIPRIGSTVRVGFRLRDLKVLKR